MTSAAATEGQYLDPEVNLNSLIEILEKKRFETKQNEESGAGQIDLVCKILVHPSLPTVNCGFIVLRADEGLTSCVIRGHSYYRGVKLLDCIRFF